LWKGSCRDRGQIEVSPSHRHVQEFLVAQAEAGMLLCLCSNNREEDVFAVFEQNPDMVLRREHILASNISPGPKTESLQALADDLQIPLDQFLYLDSDAENCAELRGSFPEVLTVQLPHDADNFRDFLRNIWAFSSGQLGNLETEWTRLASSAA